MVTANVIIPPILHHSIPNPLRRAGNAVVDNMQVRKAPGGPTQHAGLDFIHGVPSWRRPKSANRVPAFSSVDLCSASDVKHRTCFDRLHAIDNVADNSSTHTETSVTSKISNAFLEVVRFQSQISVELHDKFPIVATRRTKSIIKCIDNTSAGFRSE